MEVQITDTVYNMLLEWFQEHGMNPADYIGGSAGSYFVDYMALMDLDEYFVEIDGAVYLISMRPSQKGVFIANSP